MLGLVWNAVGYMAGITVVLEDGGYVVGCVAIGVLLWEEGIVAGSLAARIFPLIFESFVG